MAMILVVDDSAVALKLAGALVEAAGHEAVFARSGPDALNRIGRARPDVVLTDLRMPDMDGLELVTRIRRLFNGLPVILMTAHGSEEVAVRALKAGAASYVPKKMLETDLEDVLRIVLMAVESKDYREKVRYLLTASESNFVLGYEPDGAAALVSHLLNQLEHLNFCDETGLFQVGTALNEALSNAVDHGNLELNSVLREEGWDTYERLKRERIRQSPYRDRSVHVRATLTPLQVTYCVRDEGPGFDPGKLPNPMDPENVLRVSGRGIMLIRTFMDEVGFNDRGNEIVMVKRRTPGGT